MGQSTNAQISFGVAFEEGFEFPWSGEDGDGSLEDWWAHTVHGFKYSFELFDSAGNYLNGREPSEEETSRYFGERREFDAANPPPVELVNYCSGEYPMWALVVPGEVLTAHRGSPREFDPDSLLVSAAQVAALLKFCADHGIELPHEPKWLLTSYWG